MASKKTYTKSKSTKKTSKNNPKTSNTNKITIVSVIIILALFILYITNPDLAHKIFGIEKTESQENIFSGDKIIYNKLSDIYPETSNSISLEVFCHEYYCFGYNFDFRGSYWVAYLLTKKMVKTDNADRDDEKFTKDPFLEYNFAVHSDYSGSGYDRGHLCPAGDMNFNQTAMTETFYMTNILPQKPELNRGVWKDLEEKIRDWAVANDSLIIITGPIYSTNPQKIGENKIAIPSHFYKVVLDISYKNGYKGIAFLFENKNYPDYTDYMKYALTINSLEEKTGFNFYKLIENDDIKQIEEKFDVNEWK